MTRKTPSLFLSKGEWFWREVVGPKKKKAIFIWMMKSENKIVNLFSLKKEKDLCTVHPGCRHSDEEDSVDGRVEGLAKPD